MVRGRGAAICQSSNKLVPAPAPGFRQPQYLHRTRRPGHPSTAHFCPVSTKNRHPLPSARSLPQRLNLRKNAKPAMPCTPRGNESGRRSASIADELSSNGIDGMRHRTNVLSWRPESAPAAWADERLANPKSRRSVERTNSLTPVNPESTNNRMLFSSPRKPINTTSIRSHSSRLSKYATLMFGLSE